MWRDFLSRLPSNISGARRVDDGTDDHRLSDEPASKNLWVPYLIVFILFLLIVAVPVVLYIVYF